VRDPHAYVRLASRLLEPHLATTDLVIVQGDTGSALAGALAALHADVPLAHVEAGLRSHDPAMPWPEEDYRVAIDAIADLLFAPTDLAAENLRRERVPGTIFITGNSGVDAFLNTLALLPTPAPRNGGLPVLLVTCHRRENWGRGMDNVAAALCELAEARLAHIELLLPPNPYVARRRRELLRGAQNVTLLPPCSQAELVQHMRGCHLMLSDSGGVQEEAPALGVPLLVLREKTERPEALATGNMRLVGTDRRRIVDTVRELLTDPAARAAMARPALPYGDGRAGERIAARVRRWLAAGRSTVNVADAPSPVSAAA